MVCFPPESLIVRPHTYSVPVRPIVYQHTYVYPYLPTSIDPNILSISIHADCIPIEIPVWISFWSLTLGQETHDPDSTWYLGLKLDESSGFSGGLRQLQ